jgi:hypothetical protein
MEAAGPGSQAASGPPYELPFLLGGPAPYAMGLMGGKRVVEAVGLDRAARAYRLGQRDLGLPGACLGDGKEQVGVS